MSALAGQTGQIRSRAPCPRRHPSDAARGTSRTGWPLRRLLRLHSTDVDCPTCPWPPAVFSCSSTNPTIDRTCPYSLPSNPVTRTRSSATQTLATIRCMCLLRIERPSIQTTSGSGAPARRNYSCISGALRALSIFQSSRVSAARSLIVRLRQTPPYEEGDALGVERVNQVAS